MSENKKIFFRTDDSVLIYGNWRDAGKKSLAVLCLHMMPATKESWSEFQEKLFDKGYSSLAIDLRGHGESINGLGARLDYKEFSNSEHAAKIKDVAAAVSWMLKNGAETEKIVLIGASIGANLAIQFLAEHPDIPGAAALSPGLDYKGIVTMPLAKALARKQSLFLSASDDDPESYNAVQKLNEISLAKTKLRLFHNSGHGTNMFKTEPHLMDELIDWLETVEKL